MPTTAAGHGACQSIQGVRGSDAEGGAGPGRCWRWKHENERLLVAGGWAIRGSRCMYRAMTRKCVYKAHALLRRRLRSYQVPKSLGEGAPCSSRRSTMYAYQYIWMRVGRSVERDCRQQADACTDATSAVEGGSRFDVSVSVSLFSQDFMSGRQRLLLLQLDFNIPSLVPAT